MFSDKFNREIKIGHVLANGGRDGCSGIIRTGIVRGFTDSSILVDMIVPASGYSDDSGRKLGWVTRRGSFREPKLCLITGLDSATFLDSINAGSLPPEPVEPIVSFMDTSNILGPVWRNLLEQFMSPAQVVEGTSVINNGSYLAPDPVEKSEDVNVYE